MQKDVAYHTPYTNSNINTTPKDLNTPQRERDVSRINRGSIGRNRQPSFLFPSCHFTTLHIHTDTVHRRDRLEGLQKPKNSIVSPSHASFVNKHAAKKSLNKRGKEPLCIAATSCLHIRPCLFLFPPALMPFCPSVHAAMPLGACHPPGNQVNSVVVVF